jgi:hypothetical protein
LSLLEELRDRRYVELIEMAARASSSRTVSIKWRIWRAGPTSSSSNFESPRLFECLASCQFPAIRSVFWSHISGVSKPLIPPG